MLERFEQFSSVMFEINRYIQKLEHDVMVKFGYKGSYAQYLIVLNAHPDGLIASRICELCDKDKAAVSRVIGEMQEHGLVVRECAENRVYRGVVCLTERGKEIAGYVCQKAMDAVAAIGKDAMNDEERVVFYHILERISDKLHTFTKNGIPKQ